MARNFTALLNYRNRLSPRKPGRSASILLPDGTRTCDLAIAVGTVTLDPAIGLQAAAGGCDILLKSMIGGTMTDDSKETGRRIAETIGKRVQTGADPNVAGWQAMLADLLQQMSPYTVAGGLVTFQSLEPHEKAFFQDLHAKVSIPGGAAALYLPPSVRHQMLYRRQANKAALLGQDDPENPPDAGILLASRVNDFEVIVNALFAHPPFTPAVDVYDHGQLMAGYTYYQIEDCLKALGELLKVHLASD